MPTQQAEYTFTVHDSDGSMPPAIKFEPTRTSGLPVLKNGNLMIYLRQGKDEEDAKELAEMMNRLLASVVYYTIP